MTPEQQKKSNENNTLWDTVYKSFEKGILLPGIQYPDLRLVDFIRRWEASGLWPKGRRPRVLELGFGSLANMRMMAQEGCDVHGLEVSEEPVQSARKAIEVFGLGDHLSAASFEGMPLPCKDSSYDAIVGLGSVYYNLDQKLFADECDRILSPGGLIFFSFFTTRHGYMNYIDGQPGGPVRLTDDQPNPRLPGLRIFLFRNKEQFREIYGRHFDIDVDPYETDLLEVNQSWHYLRGQKKDLPDGSEMRVTGSEPAQLTPPAFKHLGDDEPGMMAANLSVMEKPLPKKDGTVFTVLQDYPNVEIVRFLATWSRRQKKDYFRHIIGKEFSSSQVQGLKALEINTTGPSHLRAMKYFKYQAHGVCLSENTAETIAAGLDETDVEQPPTLKVWDGTRLPFNLAEFDVVFSLASNLIPDQNALVQEVARTVAKNGEIFMAYASPRAGILSKAELLGGNFYRLREDFDELNLAGLSLFVAMDGCLKKLWKKYFDVTIKHFEYAGLPDFLSFQVVIGKRNSRAV